MRMLQGRAGSFAVVLKNHDVLEAPVLFQVENTVAEGPQYVLYPLQRHGCQGLHVVGRFDYNFMRADAVHLVKHAVGLAAQIALYAQRRKFVCYYAQVPAFAVVYCLVVRTVGKNLRRRLAFIARTEWTEASAFGYYALTDEVARSFGTVCGDDDPAAGNRIFP